MRKVTFILLVQTMLSLHLDVIGQSSDDTSCHEIQAPTYYHTTIRMQAPSGITCTAQDLSDIGAFIDDEYDKVVEQSDDLGAVQLQTHVCNAGTDLPPNCCSRDLQSCFNDQWCDQSGDNCENHCNGFWINPNDRIGCIPRWTSCTEDSDCCGQAICGTWPDGWRGCELPESTPAPQVIPEGCCSFNARDCYTDEWCSYSPDNCINVCGGYFLGSGYNKLCQAKWETCTDDSDCCGQSEYGVVCQDYGDWHGCNEHGVTRRLEEPYEAFERPEIGEAQKHRKLGWWWDWDGDGACKYCDGDDSDDDSGRRLLHGDEPNGEASRRRMQETTFAEIATTAETDLGIHLTSRVNENFGLNSSSCLHQSLVTIRVEITQLTTEPVGDTC